MKRLQTLDRMMAGEKVSAEALLIEPLGVQIRQSTDVLALPDPAVASAVRFIREHACTGINVNAVLRHTRVSRRVLESRFRKMLGRTPHEEIIRMRIGRS